VSNAAAIAAVSSRFRSGEVATRASTQVGAGRPAPVASAAEVVVPGRRVASASAAAGSGRRVAPVRAVERQGAGPSRVSCASSHQTPNVVGSSGARGRRGPRASTFRVGGS
jgi:hypothetical protein